MQTLKERIERAETKAALYWNIAFARKDEAIGCKVLGKQKRATECTARANHNREEAQIWEATATALRAELGTLETELTDYE